MDYPRLIFYRDHLLDWIKLVIVLVKWETYPDNYQIVKQNLIDTAEFLVKGGTGGRGAISFRREKYVSKGGPDGGEGGKGGSVILRTNPHLNTLRFYAGKDEFEARKGLGGGSQKRYGEDGEDVVLEVPVGTVVKIRTDEYRLLRGREFYGEGAEQLKHSGMKVDKVEYLTFEERWNLQSQKSEVKSQNVDALQIKDEIGTDYVQVVDMDKQGMEIVLARGGRGGKGNFVYRSSELTTPKFAQTGEKGEKFWVRLEMKVLADVGLVGLPNVGKSTLLSVLTAARPEIADYPFTTLSPNLGVMNLQNLKPQYQNSKQIQDERNQKNLRRDLVIADIPGLIEDAHKGKGLGDEFLRHVERCKLLVYVLAPTNEMFLSLDSVNANSEEIINLQIPNTKQISNNNNQIDLKKTKKQADLITEQLWEQLAVVRKEVESYGHKLVNKKYLVVVNKMDLLLNDRLPMIDYFKQKGVEVLLVSGATTEGIDELKQKLQELS